MGLAESRGSALLHADCAYAGDSDYRVWIRGVSVAGLAAACSSRLLEHFCEAGDDCAAGAGNYCDSSHTAHAGANPVYRRLGPGFRGQDFSFRLHHHCLWRDQRLPLADLERHHTQTDFPGD